MTTSTASSDSEKASKPSTADEPFFITKNYESGYWTVINQATGHIIITTRQTSIAKWYFDVNQQWRETYGKTS